MSAVKLSQPPPSTAAFTIRGSIFTLAIVTLVSFTYISLKSLHSTSLQSSPTSTPSPLTVQSSLPKVVHDADVDHVDKVVVSEKDRDQSDDEDDVYHLSKVFTLNYEEMVRRFKVYIYLDGDPNTYYQTPRKLTGKYASEGYFFKNLKESNFVMDDPDQADLFFIPISCHKMRGKGISYENMTIIVKNYVESFIFKYPYWNRTLGADHFFVTCHDVGVRATEGLPNLVKNSIRVVCSPSYDVGFIPHKDVALPQILQPFALPSGGNDIENRRHLDSEQDIGIPRLGSYWPECGKMILNLIFQITELTGLLD
ncbi:hypothetical protein OROGR_008270 [Orobanche gracilis]